MSHFPGRPALSFLVYVLCFSLSARAQDKPASCSALHNVSFYSYPPNSNGRVFSRMDGQWQHETDLLTGDTSLWQIKWTSDCSYTAKLVAGGRKLSRESQELLREHVIAFQVTAVTDSFFVFNGFLDKTSNLPLTTDTAWFHEKAFPGNSETYRKMAGNAFLRKEHFRDTSKYAVLYLYRPGKLTNSMGDFLVYCNDNVMCVAKNKTGYIFKIVKEGPLKLESRLMKDRSPLIVDIKFGQTYYVKSMIHWTISSRLYNFKLEMASIGADKGATEFEEVDLQ